MKVQNRVALITAGGSGIGAAAAKQLAKEGLQVAILSSSGKGEALAQSLGGLGVTGSNRSPEDLAKFVEATLNKWGRIDVVINSAGHGPKGDLLGLTDHDWADGLEIYLLNVIRMARLVTPVMQKNQGGSIINISTFAAVEPDPIFPTSSVFRSGLSSFTKLYADRYAKDNIRMNNILPGFIDSLPEREDFKAKIPMGRYGHKEEVAKAVSFLSSDGGAYITGQNIRVDGGLTRSL